MNGLEEDDSHDVLDKCNASGPRRKRCFHRFSSFLENNLLIRFFCEQGKDEAEEDEAYQCPFDPTPAFPGVNVGADNGAIG